MSTSTGSGQSPVKNENDSEYAAKFQQARYVFHRAYFEKSSLLIEELLLKKQNHALAHAAHTYAALADFMLYKNPSTHVKEAKKLLKKDNPEDLFTTALLYFVTSKLSDCELTLKEFLWVISCS